MFPTELQLLAIPAFVIGIILLYKGSNILVEGVSKTALKIGISSLIISVVIVGAGTSSPECAVSVGAAIRQESDISLGNIIGSCIANILLILGLSAVVKPLKVNKVIIKREIPIVILTALILLIFSVLKLLDDYRIIGSILFLLFFILFIRFFIRCAKEERIKLEMKYDNKIAKDVAFIFLGTAGVIFGAYLLLESATTLAYIFNIPPFVIALSMVAVGTSLPELAVSTVAAYKGESDVAIGNILGSNVFNIFFILGLSALFSPLGAVFALDSMIILLLVTVFLFPICFSSYRISRLEGIFMLILYAIYIWYIFIGYKMIQIIF